jgi:tRNA 2-selenouridine synthase
MKSPSTASQSRHSLGTCSAQGFSELFVSQRPLLDVRAPVEFARGAFPGADNIPLLNDDERHQVGSRYRQAGQEAAIKLGHELVSGDEKQRRLEAWQQWIDKHPEGLLYCYRGGLRSQLVQQWLADAGIAITRIEGGYKALRRFLIDSLEQQVSELDCIVVAGKTGCGKTHLLQQLKRAIDLEGQANHRGSAFGRRVQEQPSQIDFENRIAIDLLQLTARAEPASAKIFIEDESHSVGSVSVPRSLFARMRAAPLAVIEQPLETRVSTILNDYILANYSDFERVHGHEAFAAFADYLHESLARIQRRLGQDNYRHIKRQLEQALHQQAEHGDTSAHGQWIASLLSDYYDPMYDYQLGKKLDRLVFRGNAEEFLAWAAHLENTDGSSS